MSLIPVICRACARHIEGTPACTSFPDGIPDDIFTFGADHRRSIAGEPPFLLDPSRRGEYDDFIRYAPGGDHLGQPAE